jgi:uncharacterized membrane protein
VLGDLGIHQKCGDAFWKEVINAMSERLKAGQFTDSIVEGIQRIGRVLQESFPVSRDDVNELPNEIAGD